MRRLTRRHLLVAASALIAAASSLGLVASPPAFAAAGVTVSQLEDAVLPAGVCSPSAPGTPASGPIALHDGEGTVGTQLHADYYAAGVLGKTQPVALPGDLTGIAAVIECGDGGSAHWTSMWIFGGSPENLKVVAGPVGARTYAQITDTDSGSIITAVRAEGRSLVVAESFSVAGDCGGCTSGRSITTWRFAASAPHHLVIVRPSASLGRVLVRTNPAGNFQPIVKYFPSGPLARGTAVKVVCTGRSAYTGASWTELDTGAWVPTRDLREPHLSDCDGGSSTTAVPETPSNEAAPSTPSTGPAPSPTGTNGSSTSTTTSTPSAPGEDAPPCTLAALTAAAQAAGDPDVTGVDAQGYGCLGNWAYAGVDLGTEEEVTWTFMAVNGSWQRTVVQLDCEGGTSSPALPPSILQAACNSN